MTLFREIVIGIALVFWLMTFLGIQGLNKVCWSCIGLLTVAVSLAATAPG